MHRKQEELKIKQIDALNYNLGRYIGIAVNNPKAYPKKPFLAKEELSSKGPKVMTPEEMEKMARRNTIILGGTINRNGKTNN